MAAAGFVAPLADRDTFKQAARTEEFMATGKDAMEMGVPFHVHFADVS